MLLVEEFEERLRMILETFRNEGPFKQIPKEQIDIIVEHVFEFFKEMNDLHSN